jgi:hypothetical protein
MTAHSTAQGIASLGRHGDDVIVHMSREEVKGLQALAKANGTSLTINPHTGMPEAFKLGRVFKAIAPIAAGWALGPGGFGLFSSPLTAALAVGAGTGLLTGNLGQGLMAGLGAYSGFGLGDTFAKMGATTAGGITPTMTANVTQAATGAPIVGASSQFISPFTPQGIAGGAGLGVGTVNSAGLAANSVGHVQNAILSNQARNAALTGINPAFNAANNINAANVVSNTAPVSGFAKSGQGIKNLFTFGDKTTPSGLEQFKAAAGTPATATTPAKPLTDFEMATKLGAPALAIAESTGAFDEPEYTNPQGTRMKRVPTGTYDAQGKPEYKYVPAESYASTETLNVNNPYENYPYMTPPPPLRLAASGGEIQSYAQGGTIQPTIQSGGIRDLYGSSDSQTQPISKDGFGLGRLSNLASAQEFQQAKTLGYAMGGPVSFADGGDSNKEAVTLPSLIADTDMVPNIAPTNTLSDSEMMGIMQALSPFKGMKGNFNISRGSNQGQTPDQTNDSLIAKVAANLKSDPNYQPTNPIEAAIVKQMRGNNIMQGINTNAQGLGSIAPSYPMAATYTASQPIGPTYYAGLNAPGSRGYAEGGETSLNLDRLPSLNVNTGEQNYGNYGNYDISGASPEYKNLMRAFGMAGEMDTINPGARIFSRMMSGTLRGDPEMIGMLQGKGAPASLVRGLDDPAYANNPEWAVPQGYAPTAPAYSINPSSGNTSAQNSAFVNRRAKGGYLDGAGDGMSDSIPATIEGKQPARLADGEFVVPADVVSHLGNGSSKAGSKRLYAMLDKVRHARTGNKKQGKQINPAKYMPA